MKKVFLAASALFMGAALYSASASIIISVDENGHGWYTGDQNGTLNGVLAGSYDMYQSPTTHGLGPALTYALPWVISVGGDVRIREEGTQLDSSDTIRFLVGASGGVGQLVFFSDKVPDGTEGDLGDTGQPYSLIPGWIWAPGQEHGGVPSGGWVEYTPTSTQPGYVVGQNITYVFFSEVPEPTTIIAGALLLLPFGVQGVRMMRNRKLA